MCLRVACHTLHLTHCHELASLDQPVLPHSRRGAGKDSLVDSIPQLALQIIVEPREAGLKQRIDRFSIRGADGAAEAVGEEGFVADPQQMQNCCRQILWLYAA